MNCMYRNKIILLAAFLTLFFSTSAFAQSVTIKASASPKKGGSISPLGKVEVTAGDYQQFTIIPNTGYEIQDVLIDGVSQGPVNIYTFTDINQNHSIKAKFARKTFTVTVAEGGKVTFPLWGQKESPMARS